MTYTQEDIQVEADEIRKREAEADAILDRMDSQAYRVFSKVEKARLEAKLLDELDGLKQKEVSEGKAEEQQSTSLRFIKPKN